MKARACASVIWLSRGLERSKRIFDRPSPSDAAFGVAERQAEIENHPERRDGVVGALDAFRTALMSRRAPLPVPGLDVDRRQRPHGPVSDSRADHLEAVCVGLGSRALHVSDRALRMALEAIAQAADRPVIEEARSGAAVQPGTKRAVCTSQRSTISCSVTSAGKGIKRAGYPLAFVERLSADQYSRSGPRFLFRAMRPGVWLRSGMVPSLLPIRGLCFNLPQARLFVQPSADRRCIARLEQRVCFGEAVPLELADHPRKRRPRQMRRNRSTQGLVVLVERRHLTCSLRGALAARRVMAENLRAVCAGCAGSLD